MALLLGATAALLTLTSSQCVPTPHDLTTTVGYLDLPVRWKEVPEGICELRHGVKSYSGYVDVFEAQHVFFWFFEAHNQDPESAPLTVWINGGPGSSSMIGLFQEVGPCSVDADGEVVDNPYAWNNVSNMLFIDHPAQVGFSYSKAVPGYTSESGDIVQLPNATCPEYARDSCGTYSYPNQTDTANSTIDAAPSMWRTLQGFIGAFPQYSRNEFNFATESYGGHYGPIFNAYIESQNRLIDEGSLEGSHHINLATLLIGNGWYDPLIQYQAYYNFTVFPGNTSTTLPTTKAPRIASITLSTDQATATIRLWIVEYPLDTIANRDEYDIRELTPDPFPYEYYIDYLNTPKVQQALGVYVNFSDSNSAVGNAFSSTGDDDREEGTIAALQSLVQDGIYVVQFAGDADYNCNWLGGEVVSQLANAPRFDSAGYENVTTSDGVVHGQVKQSGHFAFVRVYEAGHEVPFYQPVLALEMFERAIEGKDIASGTESCFDQGYRTIGTVKSEYREGNATVQWEVLPENGTYNTPTNMPNSVNQTNSAVAPGKLRRLKRRAFKPSFERWRRR